MFIKFSFYLLVNAFSGTAGKTLKPEPSTLPYIKLFGPFYTLHRYRAYHMNIVYAEYRSFSDKLRPYIGNCDFLRAKRK